MKLNKISAAAGALALTLFAGASQAAFIDFEDRSPGVQGVGFLTYPEATFTSSTGSVYIGGAGVSNDFCAYNGSCSGDLTVTFNGAVNNLTFTTAGEQQAGLWSNAAVYVNNVFAANVGITYDGVFTSYDFVDLSAFSNVTSVVLSSTDGAGVTWDDFSFAPVPEPSTLVLSALGLAALAARRRKA